MDSSELESVLQENVEGNALVQSTSLDPLRMQDIQS